MTAAVFALMLLGFVMAYRFVTQTWAGAAAAWIVSLVVRLMLRAVGAAIPLPGSLLRSVGAVYGDLATTAVCENGCGQRLSLVGLVECRCGFRSVRHAFSPCVACGTALRFMTCPHCGLGILRPGWSTQGFEPRRYR